MRPFKCFYLSTQTRQSCPRPVHLARHAAFCGAPHAPGRQAPKATERLSCQPMGRYGIAIGKARWGWKWQTREPMRDGTRVVWHRSRSPSRGAIPFLSFPQVFVALRGAGAFCQPSGLGAYTPTLAFLAPKYPSPVRGRRPAPTTAGVPLTSQSAKRKCRSSRVRLWEKRSSPRTSSARAFFCFWSARIFSSMLFLISSR